MIMSEILILISLLNIMISAINQNHLSLVREEDYFIILPFYLHHILKLESAHTDNLMSDFVDTRVPLIVG